MTNDITTRATAIIIRSHQLLLLLRRRPSSSHHYHHHITILSQQQQQQRQNLKFFTSTTTTTTKIVTLQSPTKNNKKETTTTTTKHRLFASCLPGLEPILHTEILQKITPLPLLSSSSPLTAHVRPGGVSFTIIPASSSSSSSSSSITTIQHIIQHCHLHLGTATHLLYRCGDSFTARHWNQLRRRTRDVFDWHSLFSRRRRRRGTDEEEEEEMNDVSSNIVGRVNVSVTESQLSNISMIKRYVTRGIEDALERSSSSSLSIEEEKMSSFPSHDDDDDNHNNYNNDDDNNNNNTIICGPTLSIRIHFDEIQISYQTNNTPLHRRNYRLESGKAPLREDIAHAMLHFFQKFQKNKNMRLLDPFCGSGTIAIEAASLMCGLPPGRLREVPMKGTLWEDEVGWRRLIREAMEESRRRRRRSSQNNDGMMMIRGSDRNEGAIDIAKRNAMRAGVSDVIDFRCESFSASEWLNDNIIKGDKFNSNNDTTTRNDDDTINNDDDNHDDVIIVTNPPFGKRVIGSRHESSSRRELFQKIAHLTVQRGRKVVLLTNDLRMGRLLSSSSRSSRSNDEVMTVGFSVRHGGFSVVCVVVNKVVD